MIEIKLLDLLKTNQFGPIPLDASTKMVVDVLGEPDGGLNPEIKTGQIDVLLYGSFQFTFDSNKLITISNGHILDLFTWQFDDQFHFQNHKFRFTSWINDYEFDTRIDLFKDKFIKEGIEYYESIYFDAVKLSIGKNIELLFSSQLTYLKEPEQWSSLDPSLLNLRLSHLTLFSAI